MSIPPNPTVDQMIDDLLGALTVIKATAQLLDRRDWPLPAVDQAHLRARLATIDAGVDRAAEQLSRLVDALTVPGATDRTGADAP